MRLRVKELLSKKGITAYRLAKDSKGRLSLPAVYRLTTGTFQTIRSEAMDALCDVLGVEPGELFEREGRGRRKRESVARPRPR